MLSTFGCTRSFRRAEPAHRLRGRPSMRCIPRSQEHTQSDRPELVHPGLGHVSRKSVAHKIAGCVACSILVTLGSGAFQQPAMADTLVKSRDSTSARVVNDKDTKDAAQLSSSSLGRTDAVHRAWREGTHVTSAHTSKFTPNPVVEVAAQQERPISALMNSLFVVMLALPGLAMFYGGLSRAGSVNSALMSSALCISVASVVWVSGGYSAAFSRTGMEEGIINVRSFVGSLDKAVLSGMTPSTAFQGLPELTWFMFQLKLAIIATTIAMGGLIERAKLSAKVVMTSLWLPVVYIPICHAVAAGPGALIGDIGVIDSAGSLATHVAPGVSALVAAMMVGGRRKSDPAPHNSPMTAIGMILLWLGWLGQASGFAAFSGTSTAAALINTQMAAAVGGLTWLGFDMAAQYQSLRGLSCGVLAGLVGVTPAVSSISVVGAMVMGLVASTAAWVSVTLLLSRGWYDDCVRLYGTAAAAGIAGSLLTGVVTNPIYSGTGPAGPLLTQVVVQLLAVAAVVAWAVVGTALAAAATGLLTGGMRVENDDAGADSALVD